MLWSNWSHLKNSKSLFVSMQCINTLWFKLPFVSMWCMNALWFDWLSFFTERLVFLISLFWSLVIALTLILSCLGNSCSKAIRDSVFLLVEKVCFLMQAFSDNECSLSQRSWLKMWTSGLANWLFGACWHWDLEFWMVLKCEPSQQCEEWQSMVPVPVRYKKVTTSYPRFAI